MHLTLDTLNESSILNFINEAMSLPITQQKQRLQLIDYGTRLDTLSILLDKKTQPTEPYRRGGALMRTLPQQLSDDRGMIGIGLN